MPIQHMQTDVVRTTAQTLGFCANDINQAAQALRQSADNLSASWMGPSSEQFTGLIEPELRRLAGLAQDGELLRDRLYREVEEWERVDSRFGDSAAGSIPGEAIVTGPSIPFPGAVILPAPPQAPGLKTSYDVGETLMNYNPDYPPGMGDLMEDMHQYFKDCVMIDDERYWPDTEMYTKMAKMTGLSESEVREQFKNAVLAARKGGYDPSKNPALDTIDSPFGNHWGSQTQLMFGKVVGDHLGIHPVFATFLNPSGGIIGPGDKLPAKVLDPTLGGVYDENAWNYHGAAHDAYGYLYNHHNIGPGYEYADGPLNTGLTGSPLSGQASGYLYWVKKQGVIPQIKDVVDHGVVVKDGIVQGVDAVKDGVVQGVDTVKDGVVQGVDAVKDGIANQVDDAVVQIDKVKDKIVPDLPGIM